MIYNIATSTAAAVIKLPEDAVVSEDNTSRVLTWMVKPASRRGRLPKLSALNVLMEPTSNEAQPEFHTMLGLTAFITRESQH